MPTRAETTLPRALVYGVSLSATSRCSESITVPRYWTVATASDEGPGIPDADHDAVFDEFHQVARPDAGKAQGTGLGLAISRRLARGLGGDITLQSQEGHGATFTVSVPVVLPECEGPAEDHPGPEEP
jgi:signal transduction histidine kinase